MKKELSEEVITMEQLMNRMLVVSETSSVYKKIATYVEQNRMQIIFMTADELASKLAVSQGSVSKFCIALGYKGFADFIRSLQKIVGKEITAPERYQFTASSMHHTDDVIENEIENMRQLKEITDSQSYTEIVNAIATKREIILLSARMSATLLPYLKYMLDKLRDGVRLVTPDSNDWNYLHINKNQNDVFILAVSMPRYPSVLVNKIKELHEKGFVIGNITDSRFSPVCKYSEMNIFIPRTVASIFDLYSTPMAFMNVLATGVSQKIENVQERLDEIEKQDVADKIYYKK